MGLSKETKSVLVGTSVVILVSLVGNLVFGYDLSLSSVAGVVLGVIAGLVASKLLGD